MASHSIQGLSETLPFFAKIECGAPDDIHGWRDDTVYQTDTGLVVQRKAQKAIT
jgi:hypothetical protein